MTQFTVQGMTCQGCVRSVTRAVERLSQGLKAEVDLPSGRVTVEGAVEPERVVQAIEAAGFQVSTEVSTP
jgi:copper chaperone